MRATANSYRWRAACALTALLLCTPITFAQKGDDEASKYPAKPLTERDARRAEVEAAYRQMRSEPGVAERVIYGNDDRRDWYQILPGETVIQSLEQAVCVVVTTSEVTDNGDGTYTLSTVNWTSVGGSPVCTSERFYNQRTIGFCSGFLVGNDLIATAGHCVDSFDCGSTAFVFGFDQQSATVGPDIVVPADNVYFCAGIVDQVQAGDLDHSVVQVDRPVVGRTPVPIRRSGVVSNGDPLVMIGHPVTLPKKVDDGAVVKNANGSVGWFNANLDAYGGNSGSMVANLNTGVVEGILVRGNTD
ncbi:MAG: serine protease, partial [Planctomycetota bacterium]